MTHIGLNLITLLSLQYKQSGTHDVTADSLYKLSELLYRLLSKYSKYNHSGYTRLTVTQVYWALGPLFSLYNIFPE